MIAARSLFAFTIAPSLLLLSGCGWFPSKSGEDLLLQDGSDGTDWAGYGRTFGEQHFSPLTEINDGNVDELGLAWSLDLPVGPVATQPIAVDGVIYLSTGLSLVRAVDVRTGKRLWEYDPKVSEVAGTKLRQGWGTRGISFWKGRVYTGTLDGRLIALNAKDGSMAWVAETTEKDDGRYITGAPRVIDGLIVIGHGGADSSSVRGYVTAYNAETGKQAWRFHTVPGNPADGFENDAMKRAASTWSGDWWTKGGGGTVWNAMSYSPKLGTLFIGVGNGAPWNWRVRSEGKGDNLYLASIVALDAKTGTYKWHYQVNPSETWDYNAAMDMHLGEMKINGETRPVLMQAPKNGFLYLLDQETGKLLAAHRIAKVTWAKGIDLKTGRPLENPEARYSNGTDFELWPSPTGAHGAPPSAYDPGTKLMFIPVIEKGIVVNDRGINPKKWRRAPGNVYDFALNLDLGRKLDDPLHNTSWLLAIDPLTGKKVWRVKTPNLFNGGLMVSAGKLVFQGEAGGRFNAYSSQNGEKLWSFETGAPVIGAPISYLVDGTQYVSVVSGMGTVASTTIAMGNGKGVADYRNQPRRLLTFAIGQKATLERSPTFQEVAAADPDYRDIPELASRGAAIYGAKCFVCHGPAAISGGGAPDLRMSSVPVSASSFNAIVRDGALIANGMPGFNELTDSEILALRQYVRDRAAALRAKAD